MSLVVNLIGQRSQDVIGRLSVSRDVIGCVALNVIAKRTNHFLQSSQPITSRLTDKRPITS